MSWGVGIRVAVRSVALGCLNRVRGWGQVDLSRLCGGEVGPDLVEQCEAQLKQQS